MHESGFLKRDVKNKYEKIKRARKLKELANSLGINIFDINSRILLFIWISNLSKLNALKEMVMQLQYENIKLAIQFKM